MAGAMARGWAGGDGGPDAMLFCDLDAERAVALAEQVGGEVREGLGDLASTSDAVILAVKPAALDDVAIELADARAIVSVLAGVPVARLADAFPATPVLRLMPNQPVEVRVGVICHPPPHEMPADLAAQLLALLGLLGDVVEIEEDRLDAAMAVMSCAPAYLALIADALTDAGVREGLELELANELVAGTLEGTAELLRVRSPDEVQVAVASPGGATEQGLRALRDGGVPEAIAAAVDASLERLR